MRFAPRRLLLAATLTLWLLALAAPPRPAAAADPGILDMDACGLRQTRPGSNEATVGATPPLPGVGTLRAAVLFVDFGDATAQQTTAEVLARIGPAATDWFRTESRGRLQLEIATPVTRWLRLADPMSAYRLTFPGSATARFFNNQRIASAAVQAADAEVDFATVDLVYVVLPPGTADVSQAGRAIVQADGRTSIPMAVIAGTTDFGVLAHETGHLLGLPDLYDTSATGNASSQRFAGGWDLMSSARSIQLNAWHRWKLRWLDAEQLRCIGAGTFEATLTPVGRLDGDLKALVLPLSETAAMVIEARAATGADRLLCNPGVLIYTVSSSVLSGAGPVVVHPASDAADAAEQRRCGVIYRAAYTPDGVARFVDTAADVRVDVLVSTSAGYAVRVSRGATGGAPVNLDPTRGSGTFVAGSAPRGGGFGLVVFGGGRTSALVSAAACGSESAAFWASGDRGEFVTYIPGSRIAAVNAEWQRRFPGGVPAGTAILLRCH